MVPRALNYKDDDTFLQYLTMSFVGENTAIELMKPFGHQFEFDGYGAGSREMYKDEFLKQRRTPDLKCKHCGQKLEVRAKSALKVAMSHSQKRPFDKELEPDDWVGFVRVRRIQGSTDLLDPDSYTKPSTIFVISTAQLSRTKELAERSPPKAKDKGLEKYLVWPTLLAPCSGVLKGITRDPASIMIELPDGQNRTLHPPAGSYPYNGIRKGDAVIAQETLICGIARTLSSTALRCAASSHQTGLTP